MSPGEVNEPGESSQGFLPRLLLQPYISTETCPCWMKTTKQVNVNFFKKYLTRTKAGLYAKPTIIHSKLQYLQEHPA